ncbi:Putative two-component response regulator [Vibrio nigripulchritudo MADA3029]|uniref:response regulator transcription factor n=1 Tax=Vibrio nigripulchritudo TaxID=28173 RepID=UPI00021C1498|nr:response regulator transcription factor [Vibrio nigripulchritudo]EGU59940.1 putative two-component response regulator [Vibrio nigripulchritudo ATCC 27043]CCN32724.1 Putative two-component response regulator [Vibrio nigripulchritudo AM115]CCN39895.1 Putative two-component response regulator [Vibrio nigripulchritudo FTn2]CCN46067.1 Putative two-component response regulator [Vibrio nigripulchritudo MADA3020]CCN56624.1 Putative two-component response regulator [Vibrio nigripulchritudo MADA3021]
MLKDKKILIVEDNIELQGILADFLEVKGADVDFASDGEQGIQLATECRFDAVILDVMMPKKDGIQVIKELRNAGNDLPVLMLTALNSKEDLLNGYQNGVDDFITKPFDFDELEVRLAALIKRYRGEVASNQLSFGEITIDQSTHQVYRSGTLLSLTPVMYQILVKLVKAAPEIVTRESLIHEIWKEDIPDNDVLRSHLYLLRNVVDKPFERPLLTTVPKVGLRLEK